MESGTRAPPEESAGNTLREQDKSEIEEWAGSDLEIEAPGENRTRSQLVIEMNEVPVETPQDSEEEEKLPEQRYHEPLLEDEESHVDSYRHKVSIEEHEEHIIRYCRETGSLYEDEDFPPAPTSLFTDIDNPPDYDKSLPYDQWVRPKDIDESPELFVLGAAPGDVQQGALGDCWFIGALSVLATHPQLLERLFVSTEYLNECGFVTCQFFKNGNWEQVIVDTRLPYNTHHGTLIYAHCQDHREM